MSSEGAVERLVRAAATGVPCAPLRDLIGTDVTMAYDVQRAVIPRSGGRVVGRKIGLTSPAVLEQLGVDQPDFGVLLDHMDYTEALILAAASLERGRLAAGAKIPWLASVRENG